MAVPWVREGIRRLIGFEPYSGTLNVRLVDPDALVAWRRIREGLALRLVPPPPETCGARLFRAVVAPDVSPEPLRIARSRSSDPAEPVDE